VRQALRFAAEREAELLPAVGRVRIGVGELFYERDDLDTSERELILGIELVERAGEWRYW
jgi:MalT-like TPR region